MDNKKKNNKRWLAGLVTAMAASLCCLTPMLALFGTASGFAGSFSWVEPFRPYLIGLTVLVFALAWYQKLHPQKKEGCDCETGAKESFWQSKSLGIVTVVAALLISFPYYAKAVYQKPQQSKQVWVDQENIQQAFFKIKGMTCESCTQHVNTEISKLKGILSFETVYENAGSTVKFDNSKTSIDCIAAAINSTGYNVVAQTLTTTE